MMHLIANAPWHVLREHTPLNGLTLGHPLLIQLQEQLAFILRPSGRLQYVCTHLCEATVTLHLARRIEAVVVCVGVRVEELEGLLASLGPTCHLMR